MDPKYIWKKNKCFQNDLYMWIHVLSGSIIESIITVLVNIIRDNLDLMQVISPFSTLQVKLLN